MTDFLGQIIDPLIEASFTGRKAIYDRVPVATIKTVDDPLALDPDAIFGATGIGGGDPFVLPTQQDFAAVEEPRTNVGLDFFERIHVVPREFALGNVLATLTVPVEVMNAFRRAPKDWDTFTNNAGTGVTLLGLPSLPVTIANLSSRVGLNLEVGTTGPPVVDSTLDFGFDVPITLFIPITLRRVVLFGVVPPELPYREVLGFLTEIHRSKDDTEKRQSLREHPRQTLRFEFGVEEGRQRTVIDNLLFAQQGTTFGVPVYHEAALLTASLLAAATNVPVDTTSFGDFRTDGFIVIIEGETFDVVQTTAINPTSFDVDPPLTNAYSQRALVMPLRLAETSGRAPARRHRRGLSFVQIDFRVVDNDSAVAPSAAAFSAYSGKPLLDDPNYVRGTIAEQWARPLIVLDNQTGRVFQASLPDRSRHLSPKTFWATGRQAIWELRQLLHFLRGRQVSFYLPSFADDFELLNPIVGASNQLDVRNTGYGQTVNGASPRNVIKVTFNNGDSSLLREVLSAVEVSATLETLTLGDTWPSGVPVDEVARIEIVEKVRLDEDDITIEYQIGGAHQARVATTVTSVLE